MNNSSSNCMECKPMMRTRAMRAAIAALVMASWFEAAIAEDAPRPADTARAEIGKPVQAARDLIQAKKYKDALAKLHEAEVVPTLTGYEKFVIDLTRGSAAQGAGDNDTAMSSFESAV